jgi:type 1 glutamine amidotransferase
LKFIRDGHGFVAVHAGSSVFYDWPEFQQIGGGSWKPGQTGHGHIHQFAVKPLNEDHPVTRGLTNFLTTDELWHRTALQTNIQVLATAYSAPDKGGTGRDEPVVFITHFGQGRSFTLLLGHDVRAMESDGFKTLLRRGTEWAATGIVSKTKSPTEKTK